MTERDGWCSASLGDWFLALERPEVLAAELASEGLPKDLRSMDPESILVGTGQAIDQPEKPKAEP